MNRRNFISLTGVSTMSFAFLPAFNTDILFQKSHIRNYCNMQLYNEDANFTAKIIIDFTKTYQQYPDTETELREAACYKIQWEGMVRNIEPQDLFAGRFAQTPVGFIPQSDESSMGYYFHQQAFDALLQAEKLSAENREDLIQVAEYWKNTTTVEKARMAFDEPMREALKSDLYYAESGITFTLWRLSGVQLDYAKLVKLGIPGLRNEIQEYKAGVKNDTKAYKLYTAMEMALDTLCEVCYYYALQVSYLIHNATDNARKADLIAMKQSLIKLPSAKPETFRDGIQLILLYNGIDGARNYGRIDEALGDLYITDLQSGKLTEEEGIRLLTSVWKIIIARGYKYDSRMIIGGKGRENEANADNLALVIMETSRRVKDIMPQLAFRFYKGQNPDLYQKALDVIGEGNPFPMLYNDDVNIPSAQKAFDIPLEEAIHVIQYGCGEYVLNHRSVGTPSAVINLVQALLVTLHKGVDPITKKPMGMPADRYLKYANFNTFDQLWSAYEEQVEYHIDQVAKHEELEYVYAGKDAPFLYSSMLMDDCIKRGKGIYAGGIRYLGGTLESYGNSNVADSFTAIKQLVYEQKIFTLEKLVQILDADFVGFEKERKIMLDCPKYGNDNDAADNMLIKVHEQVCNYTRSQRDKTGLHSYLIVIINNDANTVMGEHTPASPDGRKALTYLNPGNAPVGGADKNGVTAFLNSVSKPNTSIHAGAVQNIKFSKEMFTKYRKQTEILLDTYWQKGGAQAMLTVVGRGDLEDAMLHPELYPNLLVRVGGFSERFVNLPHHTQLELLSRTLY